MTPTDSLALATPRPARELRLVGAWLVGAWLVGSLVVAVLFSERAKISG